LLALGVGSSFAAELPDTTDDMVILAKDRVTLSQGSELNSGQIAVNDAQGKVTVAPRVRALSETEIIADIVAVNAPASRKPELFDIFTNSFRRENHAVVDGEIVSPLGQSLPLFHFPSAPAVTPGADPCPNGTGTGGNCVIRRRNGPVTLPQGDYGRITVWEGGVLYLQGTYNIESLRTGSLSSIVASGSATINVQKGLSFGWCSTFEPVDGVNARCVVLNVAGHYVQIAGASIISAVINAPNATVSLGSTLTSLRVTYVGNLAAKRVIVGPGATLQSPDPLLSTCQ
jgi:hypothetical protein